MGHHPVLLWLDGFRSWSRLTRSQSEDSCASLPGAVRRERLRWSGCPGPCQPAAEPKGSACPEPSSRAPTSANCPPAPLLPHRKLLLEKPWLSQQAYDKELSRQTTATVLSQQRGKTTPKDERCKGPTVLYFIRVLQTTKKKVCIWICRWIQMVLSSTYPSAAIKSGFEQA